MGLCKCPRKVVTTLFCYEHRVNVCQYCLVTNHPSCIIQSYLNWLQDAEYNPSCTLCARVLSSDECIRLVCYHVFHWNCFRKYCDKLPVETAPAGYKCPTCSARVIPQLYHVSPVFEMLREKLSTTEWGEKISRCLPRNPSMNTNQLHPTTNTSSYQKSPHQKLSHHEYISSKWDKISQTKKHRLQNHFDSSKLYVAIQDKNTSIYMSEEESQVKYKRRRGFQLWTSVDHLSKTFYCKFAIIILSTFFIMCIVFSLVLNDEFGSV